jgi:hypothetical protein
VTDQTKVQHKDISNDDRHQDLLIEQVAELFSNSQFTELLATDPDKAFATFGLNPQEVYRLLRNPTKLTRALQSRKAS